MGDRAVERLLGHLLTAPGSEAGWSAFLEAMCDALNANGASLISHDLTSNRGAVSATARIDPEGIRRYNEHWVQVDSWARHPAAATLRTGSVVLCHTLVADAELTRTPFYNDFARYYRIGGVLTGMIEAGRRRCP